ncbi:MAG TPA: fumarylacetoacetate hydrolase family protein [Flavobacterium sp.]|nr:fumarylacetoacetate hydrolase family protein [Flavobacterium sp.]
MQRIAGIAPRKEMKIICIGRNYTKHIEELQNERPQEPVVFMKPDSAVLLKQHPFVIPEFSEDIHHELEIIVKINKVGKYIDAKFAHKYYDEIGVGIDFTARDLQQKLKDKGLPWEKAKAFDGSAVIGEFLPKSNFSSLENLTFELTKNGETVQKGNSSHMLWKIDELISYVSQYFTLKIGDIIFTGTPEGVGIVKPEDVLEGFLEGNKLFRIHVK